MYVYVSIYICIFKIYMNVSQSISHSECSESSPIGLPNHPLKCCVSGRISPAVSSSCRRLVELKANHQARPTNLEAVNLEGKGQEFETHRNPTLRADESWLISYHH